MSAFGAIALTGGGAGAGAGAAASAGALSFAAPLAIGFGVLGIASARRQNRFLRESAEAAFESLDKQITQLRIRTIDDAITISAQAQIEAGQAEAAFGGVTGASVSTILASFATDVAEDTAVLKRNEEAGIEAIEAQKEDVSNQAASQLKNPAIAGILMGLSGFQAGLSLDAAAASADRLKALKLAEDRLGAVGQQRGTIDVLNATLRRDASNALLTTRRRIFGSLAGGVGALGSSIKALEQ